MLSTFFTSSLGIHVDERLLFSIYGSFESNSEMAGHLKLSPDRLYTVMAWEVYVSKDVLDSD